MRRYPGLRLRGAVYYLRVRVPADLLAVYAPKTQIWRSLRTKSHKEAVQQWRIDYPKLDREFADHRARLKAEQSRKSGAVLERSFSDTEIERLAEIFYYIQLSGDDDFRECGSGEDGFVGGIARQLQEAGVAFETPWSPEDLIGESGLSERDFHKSEEAVELVLPAAREWLARGNTKPMAFEIDSFLEAHDVQVRRDSKQYRKASLAILKAYVRALEAKKARNAGQVVETPTVAPLAIGGPTLTQAFDRWRAEHQSSPQKTIDEFQAQLNRFISLHGDLPLDRITKTHVREFKDALLRYPAKLSNAERKLPVAEVLKRYEGHEVARLSPRTINEKCLAAIKAILGHAVQDGLIENNPAAGISAKEDKQAVVSRLPYSNDDIRLIMAWPIFTENHRPKGGGGEAAKWLPLMAMFSGARLEELAALTREDFGIEEGVRFMRLTGRVKNAASRRKIPVHSKLVELGLLKYVEAAKAGPIFPLLDGESEKVSHGWSKWWGRYARANGITDDRKVFHSFRHTAKRRMRDACADKTLRDAVMGHTAKDEAERYGLDEEGLGIALGPLAQAIEAISYPVFSQEPSG